MRTKQETYDGVTLRYAAITLGTVKAWRETGNIDSKRQIVLNALTAARAEGEPEWDDKRFDDTFDSALLTIVANDIMKYSGVPLSFPDPLNEVPTPAKSESEGEGLAAIGSTSTISGAA